MATAIIQGSSSGLGQELARYLLKNTALNIVALTHRQAGSVRDGILSASSGNKQHDSRLTVIDGVDVVEEQGLEKAAKQVEEQGGEGDVRLVACLAGVLHPEKSLAGITLHEATHSFQVNTLGHVMIYKHFVPLIPTKRQFEKLSAEWEQDPANGVVHSTGSLCWSLSARVGSIGDNEKGGWYSYRASKSALNQVIRCLDHELAMKHSSALAMAYHPGTVLTAFTAPILGNKAKASVDKGTFELDDAVRRMAENMLASTPERRGGFIDWKGQTVPW